MKEVKIKPPLGDKLPVKILVGTVKILPKAAVRAAGNKIKNAAGQKAEELLSPMGNPQDQSPGANAGDTMVRGGEVIAEKAARAAVSTVKTGVKIGSAVHHARNAAKIAKDLTAEIKGVTEAVPTPEASAEVSPIKTRDVQANNVKTRAEPMIKTAPADIKTMENSGITNKSSAQNGAQPKVNDGAPSALSPGAADTAPNAVAQGKPNGSSIPTAKQNALKIKERDAKIARTEKLTQSAQAAPQANRIKTRSTSNGAQKQLKASTPASPKASTITPHSVQKNVVGAPQKPRTQQIKTRTIAKTKTVPRGIKTNNTKIRQTGAAAKKTKQVQAAKKLAQKTAQQAVRVAKITAEKAAQAAKIIAKAVASAVKACIAALQSMFAALVAIGGTAFAVILIICLVALLAGSVLGIFFAAEPTGHGIPIQDAMSSLNEEYYSQISKIQEDVPHDHIEIKSSDGVMGMRWEDVLAIYASKISGGENATELVTIDEAKLNILRNVLVDMNNVKYKTRVDSKEITVPVYDADGQLTYDKNGNPITETQIITETTLIIELEHKTPAQMAGEYGFNANQYEALSILQDAQYASLWGQLLGGLTMDGSGEIITPDTDWNGTDIYAWPLPKSFSITSRFGYRKDPFTGKISYHSGTDIAAPYGTPILAAASGTVTVANATDPWGFSYGYHVKLDHGAGKETLYAHCSSICVTPGQEVQKGEVIGYVGSTGNSTGNHLHFEARVGGTAVDGMGYFAG